jgi:hypothetical protein
MGRLERMKRDSGIKGRDDRSSGIEILMADAFANNNPTDPLRLAKQAERRKWNGSDSSGICSEETSTQECINQNSILWPSKWESSEKQEKCTKVKIIYERRS